MTHTQGGPSAPLDSPSSYAQERHRLLQQVAQFANAVMRLSHKMHQTGRLSPGEHDLLHSHMSLLDGSVQQLRPSTTSSCGYLLHATTQLTAPHKSSNASDGGGDHQAKKTKMKIPSTSTTSTTCKIEKKRSRRRLRREFNDKTCQHCQTHYTSQWRTGPAGPSTYARQAKLVGQHTAAANDTAPHTTPPPTRRTSVHFLLN